MNFSKLFKIKPLGLFAIAALAIGSCADDKTSLYNPNYEAAVTSPTISAITPSTGYLAGVASITITGENLTSDTSKIRAYFNGKKGLITAASSTQLEVVANKDAIGDSVMVKVGVFGAENFSNTLIYKLASPLVSPSKDLKATDFVTGNAMDANGDMFLHVIRDNATMGIQKINMVTGEMTQAIPPANITAYNDLEVGKDGKIIAVQSKRGALFSYTIGTSTKWTPQYIVAGNAIIDEFVFDDSNRIWTVGKKPAIARFDYDAPATKKTFDLGHTLSAVDFYDGKLYVAGDVDGELQIYTYEIDGSGELVNGSSFYKLSAFSGNTATKINCMKLASDGTVYIGVDSPTKTRTVDGEIEYYTENGLIEINATGSSANYLYPGVISGNIVYMFWTNNELLNIVREKVSMTVDGAEVIVQQQNIYQLNMLNKLRAPYYGN